MENQLEQIDPKTHKFIIKNVQEADQDRNAFADETQAVIQKQASKIKFLVNENKALKQGVTEMHEKNYIQNNFIGH